MCTRKTWKWKAHNASITAFSLFLFLPLSLCFSTCVGVLITGFVIRARWHFWRKTQILKRSTGRKTCGIRSWYCSLQPFYLGHISENILFHYSVSLFLFPFTLTTWESLFPSLRCSGADANVTHDFIQSFNTFLLFVGKLAVCGGQERHSNHQDVKWSKKRKLAAVFLFSYYPWCLVLIFIFLVS